VTGLPWRVAIVRGIALPVDKMLIAQRAAARHVKVKRMTGRAQICSDTNLLLGHAVIVNQNSHSGQAAIIVFSAPLLFKFACRTAEFANIGPQLDRTTTKENGQ
jgi:hypothetical protein